MLLPSHSFLRITLRFAFCLLALLLTFQGAAAQDVSDTTLPFDVERLTGTPANGQVGLQWDVASDDVGVQGYKIYYGTESVNHQNTNTYSATVDAGDVIEYIVSGLKNETTYYFAVTAVDAAGNESEYYSPEVSAAPSGSLVAASVLSEFEDASTSVSPEKAGLETGDTTSGPGAASERAASAGAAAGDLLTAADVIAASPEVVSAQAVDKNKVKVVFSEKMLLPSGTAETAFVIQDNLTLENLIVSGAHIDPDDKDGKTVLLATDEQIPQTEYVLTVGLEITNASGNTVLRGKNDSVLFQSFDPTVTAASGEESPSKKATASESLGKSDGTPEAANGRTAPGSGAAAKAFGLQKMEVVSDTILLLTFSEPAVLSLDPLENFTISEKSYPDKKLPITAVTVNDTGNIVTLTTGLQSNVVYMLSLTAITNDTAETFEVGKETFDFQGKGSSVTDTTPPEDVTNLVAKILKDLGVRVQWKGSVNNAGDLLEYLLYQSTDSGKLYGKLLSLPNNAVKHEVQGLTPGEYYFKVTAKDTAGNESKGRTVKVRLVETGPGVGILALLSMGLARVMRRRRAA